MVAGLAFIVVCFAVLLGLDGFDFVPAEKGVEGLCREAGVALCVFELDGAADVAFKNNTVKCELQRRNALIQKELF